MLPYILSILLLLIIVYLLLVPIRFFIDTSSNQYFIQAKGLAKASIVADEQEFIKINLKVFFFSFNFYPLKKEYSSQSKKVIKKVAKKNRKKSLSFKTVLRVIKTFKVRQFRVDIDSGDCISNSKLYPVFAFLNYYKSNNFNVNFEGRNTVLLSIENRPIHIIKSFINI